MGELLNGSLWTFSRLLRGYKEFRTTLLYHRLVLNCHRVKEKRPQGLSVSSTIFQWHCVGV